MAPSIETLFTGSNAYYLEELIEQFKSDPSQLDPSVRAFFEGEGRDLVNGGGLIGRPFFKPRSIFNSAPAKVTAAAAPAASATQADLDLEFLTAQMRVAQLINSYRRHGHLKATLDPLGLTEPEARPELQPNYWGLSEEYLDRRFSTAGLYGPSTMTLRELIDFLEETYARTIGAEFMHLTSSEEIEWLREQCESTRNHYPLNDETRRFILERLVSASTFEEFLHVKFIGAKRFSLQGAESLIPLLALLIEHAGDQGVDEVVLGMAHRGRLNVLVNIFQKDVLQIFSEFEDLGGEEKIGKGDVKYHMGFSSDVETRSGRGVHLSMAFNPSHLEAINPIVTGRVRAKQERLNGAGSRDSIMPVLIHGDAAFIGQGIVMETLNLMSLGGYSTEGTIHVIVNNQIGFTTLPDDSRSSTYCTDIAKMIECPIFHVNGEDPEAVAQTVRIAAAYRQKFKKDFIIDMYGFRRYGHNEADEPTFTQPEMYDMINSHPPVTQVYGAKLASQNSLGADETLEVLIEREHHRLDGILSQLRKGERSDNDGERPFQGIWKDYQGGADTDTPVADTKISRELFDEVMQGMTRVPDDFNLHRKLQRLFKQRDDMREGKRAFDWGAGEALAFGSLCAQGYPVRITGQDAERGTFSHRHCMLNDRESGARYAPLANLRPDQGRFDVFNSPLSEAAVLGFEFGYAMDTPEALVIWEAQFGDFANGAQIIIDQFISSCEDKWERLSGVTMLLPHGYEGQGPEHSSARLERFLQLCAEDNMQVCNLTTPAQIFHALRRQVVRPWRKPLIVMTPKSLLRHRRAVSQPEDFTEGRFQRLIPETYLENTDNIERVVMCSGKVFYDLLERREAVNDTTTALIRLEQIYPTPLDQIRALVERYGSVKEFIWCQEEPENMGAFYFLFPRLTKLFADSDVRVSWVCREPSASPATGSPKAHKIEQTQLVTTVFPD